VSDFTCSRCDRSGVACLTSPPFPTPLGDRIVAEICAECWEDWKRRQMLLINHHGLKLHLAESRDFLYAQLRAFLFGEGEADAGIDTDLEGSVSW